MKYFNDYDEKYPPLSYLLSIYLNLDNQYIADLLEEYQVSSIIQLPLLYNCYNKGEIRQKELIKRLNRDNSVVTRQLRQLEDLGIIKRREDNDNRRENIISLTDRGKEVTEKLLEVESEREDKLFEDLEISKQELRYYMINLVEKSIDFNRENRKD